MEQAVVVLEGGSLIAKGFVTNDRLVVSHFEQLSPRELDSEFDRCLTLGVKVAEVASPILAVDFVRREFESTVSRQGELIGAARQAFKEELAGVLEPLLGSEGLPRLLRETVAHIDQELRKYFDEESARSISAVVGRKMDEAVLGSERRVAGLLAGTLDVTDESKGIGKLYRHIRREGEVLQGQLTDLIANVSTIVARKAEIETSPRKGGLFQTDVYHEVARLARVAGDTVEETGFIAGDAQQKRGDVLVTIDPRLTSGVEANFTIEAMDRSDASQRAVLQELEEAMVNRHAHAAIAVLSSHRSPASASQPIRWFPGNRLICVVDKESWSTLALEVAYCWARVQVLQATHPAITDEVDVDRVQALVDEAARHLTDLERLRAKLGVSRSAISDSEDIISRFEAKLVSCLARISAHLEQRSGGE